MVKVRVAAGLVLFTIGALLFFGCFPVLKLMTKDVLEDGGSKYSLDYKSYNPGDTIYFSGEVEKAVVSKEDVYWTAVLGWIGLYDQTVCILDVDGEYPFFFIISGNATAEVPVGFDIYGKLTLKSSRFFGYGEYWSAESTEDLHYALIVKIFFAIIAIAGVFLVATGLKSRKA
ncbi:MAG: hypothetical protein QW728_04155 [Thermoplasmata archaeon]